MHWSYQQLLPKDVLLTIPDGVSASFWSVRAATEKNIPTYPLNTDLAALKPILK